MYRYDIVVVFSLSMEIGTSERNIYSDSFIESAWGGKVRHLEDMRDQFLYRSRNGERSDPDNPYMVMYEEWLDWLREEGYREPWQQAWDKWRSMAEQRKLLPFRTDRYSKAIEEKNEHYPFLASEGDVDEDNQFDGYESVLNSINFTIFHAKGNQRRFHEETLVYIFHTDWLRDGGYKYHAYARYMGAVIIREIVEVEQSSLQ